MRLARLKIDFEMGNDDLLEVLILPAGTTVKYEIFVDGSSAVISCGGYTNFLWDEEIERTLEFLDETGEVDS